MMKTMVVTDRCSYVALVGFMALTSGIDSVDLSRMSVTVMMVSDYGGTFVSCGLVGSRSATLAWLPYGRGAGWGSSDCLTAWMCVVDWPDNGEDEVYWSGRGACAGTWDTVREGC